MNAQPNEKFINPYSFVPFPQGRDEEKICPRSEPAGHQRLLEERYAGRLKVTWDALSPVALPTGYQSGAPVEFPGSTAKGAVRSLHEALAGGCLRVIDSEYLPTYRSQVESGTEKDWKLLWITAVNDDGQPTEAIPCKPGCSGELEANRGYER